MTDNRDHKQEIRDSLASYLAALRLAELAIEPFVGEDPALLTPERLKDVDQAIKFAENAGAIYERFKTDAGWV